MNSSPIIETDRLLLRELNKEDRPFLRALLSNPRVMSWWPAPLTTEQSDLWVERQLWRYGEHRCGYWLAVDRGTGTPVGQAGVMIIEIEGVEEAALGWIMDERVWCKGYATEAARACVEWVGKNLDSKRAIALIQPGNTPSERVATKLGMKVERNIVYADLEHAVWV